MAKTYNELYLAMRRALKEAGVEEYALEARRLLAQGAGYTDAQFIARMYMYAGDEAEKAAEKLLQRRLSGEPLAYIAGKWEFFGLEMIVTPAVLIPRMDTEPLVFTALEILKDVPEPRILDLCCGSGCIGCALGVNLPKARVIFADISPEALSVTRKNISLHRLNPRAVALEADALAPPPLRMQNFDLIACNPPYITEEECQALDTSVRDWEPMLALDGGEDGLVFYRSVLQNWKSVLKDGGWIIFEVGEGQAADVRALLLEAGFHNLGYGFDRIENVLWRVYHGELDGYKAEEVVLMIGTNNIGINNDNEIVEGIRFLLSAIRQRQTEAKIKGIGILPRRNQEERVRNLNLRIRQIAETGWYTFKNPGTKLLQEDGKINESLFSDGLHPNEEGYKRIVDEIAH